MTDKDYKFNPQYPDEYCMLDKTFTDFDLRNVPVELLQKQFVNFKDFINKDKKCPK